MNYTEQLQQKFFTLPQSLQDAVRSDANNQFLVGLAKKYMLNDDQQMDLVHTSAYVLLGEVPRADFAHRIANIDGVGEQAAQAMAKMIDEKLFAPLAKDIAEAAKNPIPRVPVETLEGPSEETSPQEQEVPIQKTPPRISEDVAPPVIVPPAPELEPEPEEVLEAESAPNSTQAQEPSSIAPEPIPQPIEALETAQTQDEDLPKETGVITIPTITVTKPPRFIPLKDLKQGSIKMRPAPEGIPSRNTMPSFSQPSAGAIHTLKNDVAQATPTQTPSVLPRIEPTPEKLASTIQPPVPTPTPQPHKAPVAQGGSGDPYREPIEP